MLEKCGSKRQRRDELQIRSPRFERAEIPSDSPGENDLAFRARGRADDGEPGAENSCAKQQVKYVAKAHLTKPFLRRVRDQRTIACSEELRKFLLVLRSQCGSEHEILRAFLGVPRPSTL
jgi:hypothetical protein